MSSLKRFCSVSWFILLFTTASIVQGRYVYQPRLHRWIARDIIVATWEEAQQHCKSQGATLASPTDTELLKYMQSVIEVNNHTTPYFIGIKAKHSAELQFVSQEGILLEDISETVQNMIEWIDPRDGDCLCMDRNSIRVVPCWSRLPYMCYKSADVTTTDAPTTTVGTSSTAPTTSVPSSSTEKLEDKPECNSAPGYHLYPTGSYYKLQHHYVSWYGAHKTCSKEGGYLVVINNYAEARILSGICGGDSWEELNISDDVNEIYNEWSQSQPDLDCTLLTQIPKTRVMPERHIFDGPDSYVCEKDYCD